MIVDQLNDILNGNSAKTTLVVFCKYVKDHIEDIPNMTIDEIASSCYVSKGQVSKLVKELDYHNYEEFIDDCKGYLHAKTRRKQFYNASLTTKENNLLFTSELSNSLYYMSEHLDLDRFNALIEDIHRYSHIYLYARGDARMSCYRMQMEFKYHSKPCTLCDAEFKKDYHFTSNDLLIYISTNGDTLVFDQRIYRRVVNSKVDKWLITCNPDLKLDHRLLLESNNSKYNQYLIRHVLDLLSIHL